MKLEVTEPHTRSSENPIAFSKGERVRVGRRSADQWPGWVYCTHPNGREGWVAETMLEMDGQTGTARRDYNAIELSVAVGERLEGFEIAASWQWCRKTNGDEGWVPLECLQTI